MGGPLITVFACGEPERGDDFAGLAAVRRWAAAARRQGSALARAAPEGEHAPTPRALVVEVGALEAADLLALPDGASCVIVDAVIGVAPGTIVVCSLADIVGGSGSWRGFRRRTTSHGGSVAEALRLATIVGEAAPEGTFVGIGALGFELGAPLSAAVRRALPRAAAAIETAVAVARPGPP